MEETPRPDINLSQIKVGGTVGGLIFAVGSMTIFLVGVQGLWLFLVGAIALGAAFASIFYLVRRAAAKSESRNTMPVV
ncbi:MAG TPA: hypothetical protein VFP40_01460 [Terriglobales bacterium]|nr:hypothetical protein [Terriglobales bacterium]